MGNLIPVERIENKIFLIRGQKVMIDRDLAELYGVKTKVLNQAVKRNQTRFPGDFMFQITLEEKNELVTNCDRFKNLKHSSASPYAFTEQGIAMLSSVLNSERAVQMNIIIMRAFVKLRYILSTHKELALKFRELEGRMGRCESDVRLIFAAIKELMDPPPEKKINKIGFMADNEE